MRGDRQSAFAAVDPFVVANAGLSAIAPFYGDDIDAEVATLPGVGLGEVSQGREELSALGRVHALFRGDDGGGIARRDAAGLDFNKHDHASGAMLRKNVGFAGGREKVASEDGIPGVLQVADGDVFAGGAERIARAGAWLGQGAGSQEAREPGEHVLSVLGGRERFLRVRGEPRAYSAPERLRGAWPSCPQTWRRCRV